MTTLEQAIKTLDLNWSKSFVERDSGGSIEYSFPLKPRDFLNFAKQDFQGRGSRALVNALSNAKRAIDCQTDAFLFSLGYHPDKVATQIGKSKVATLIRSSKIPNAPAKLRVLEYLGVVTPNIISRIRTLRNLLEHRYKKPTRRQVSDAIDVASLYVKACQGMMNDFLTHAVIGNEPKRDGHYGMTKGMYLSFTDDSGAQIEVLTFQNKEVFEKQIFKLTPRDYAFFLFLKILFAINAEDGIEEAIKSMVEELDPTQAKRKIRIKVL